MRKKQQINLLWTKVNQSPNHRRLKDSEVGMLPLAKSPTNKDSINGGTLNKNDDIYKDDDFGNPKSEDGKEFPSQFSNNGLRYTFRQ